MEKRYQMVAEGIIISALIVLSESEREKLECKDLEKTITNIAKDLHVDWAVETNGNITVATVSRTYGPVVGDTQAHDVEIAATNFMSAVDKLTIPCAKQCNESMLEDDSDDSNIPMVVVAFVVDKNAARVIKAIRESTNATLEQAKLYAKNGRIVCTKYESQSIIDNLDVAGATNVHIDEELTDHYNFCCNIINTWDETEDTAQTTGAVIMCGVHDSPLQLPCGKISEDLLKEMFITYIQSM